MLQLSRSDLGMRSHPLFTSTTKIRSWYDVSSSVIVQLKVVARPKHFLRNHSMVGGSGLLRSPHRILVGPSNLMKLRIPMVLNRTVDLGPTKSVIDEVGRTFGGAGFWIGVSSSGS